MARPSVRHYITFQIGFLRAGSQRPETLGWTVLYFTTSTLWVFSYNHRIKFLCFSGVFFFYIYLLLSSFSASSSISLGVSSIDPVTVSDASQLNLCKSCGGRGAQPITTIFNMYLCPLPTTLHTLNCVKPGHDANTSNVWLIFASPNMVFRCFNEALSLIYHLSRCVLLISITFCFASGPMPSLLMSER